MGTCRIRLERNDDGTAVFEVEGDFIDLVNMLGSALLQDEDFRRVAITAIIASEEQQRKGSENGQRTLN